MANSWFVYNGGAVNDPLNYSKVAIAPNCPTPNDLLCAVFADIQIINGVDRPYLVPIQLEIDNAVATLKETTNVTLRPD